MEGISQSDEAWRTDLRKWGRKEGKTNPVSLVSYAVTVYVLFFVLS